MKKILLLLTLAAGITATAQVKVGTNPTTLAANANFQVEGTATTDQFIVLKNGNVGIGTTTPTQKLTIGGTGNVLGVDNASGFAAKNSAGVYETFLTPRWSDNIMYLDYGSNGFNIRNSAQVINTMFMTNTGNVGIGTTSPSHKLHVVGAVGIGNATTPGTWTSNGSDIILNTGEASSAIYLRPNGNGSTANQFQASGITGHSFFGLDGLEKVRISATGNVGIGTLSPSALLDVNGTIKISGGTPGAGKVLTSDADGLAYWATPAAGSVTSVTGTAPISVATGTSTPAISIATANATTTGALTGADWTTFNNKQATISATAPITLTGAAVGIATANTTTTGALTGADWTTFNNKIGSANNGLTLTGTLVELGGTLTKATTIANAGFNLGITGTGNLGIGNTAPAEKLHVTGNIRSSGLLIADPGNNQPFLRGGDDSQLWDINEAETMGIYGQGNSAEGGLKLGSGGGKLYGKSGNIGIGTTSPAATLDVNGTIKISGGTPGAGKVLTSDADGLASWTTPTVANLNVDNTSAAVAAPVIQTITAGSLQFTSTNTGIIMKSADGTNWMLTVANNGVLTLVKVTP